MSFAYTIFKYYQTHREAVRAALEADKLINIRSALEGFYADWEQTPKLLSAKAKLTGPEASRLRRGVFQVLRSLALSASAVAFVDADSKARELYKVASLTEDERYQFVDFLMETQLRMYREDRETAPGTYILCDWRRDPETPDHPDLTLTLVNHGLRSEHHLSFALVKQPTFFEEMEKCWGFWQGVRSQVEHIVSSPSYWRSNEEVAARSAAAAILARATLEELQKLEGHQQVFLDMAPAALAQRR